MMKIDLDDMTDEKLDKLVKIASIAKISAEIEAMKNEHELKMADLYAKIESMSYNNAKLEVERAKTEKEMRLYPWVAVFLGMIPIAVAIVAVFK